MESKLAREAQQALLADTRLMTPEERLNAFLEHCQLMAALYDAGQQLRSDPNLRRPDSKFRPAPSLLTASIR